MSNASGDLGYSTATSGGFDLEGRDMIGRGYLNI